MHARPPVSLLAAVAALAPFTLAQGQLTRLPGPAPQTNLGGSIALEGDVLAVGAFKGGGGFNGAVFVYERQPGGSWLETKQVLPSTNGTLNSDGFGTTVSLHGDTLAAGAYADDAVYLFERDLGGPGAWGESARITAPAAAVGTWFGYVVALSGDTLAVTARDENSSAGAVYVYLRDLGGPGVWGLAQKLVRDDPAPGDYFGCSLDIEGGTIAAGAYRVQTWGAVELFERDPQGAPVWSHTNTLALSGTQNFGLALDLESTRLAIGSPRTVTSIKPNGLVVSQGAVHVYERSLAGASDWAETAYLTPSECLLDYFGEDVALDGDLLAACSGADDQSAGSIHVFELAGGSWQELNKLVPGQAGADLQVIDLEGSTLCGGAWQDRTVGLAAGMAYVYEQADHVPAEIYCTAGKSAEGCRGYVHAFGQPSATATDGFEVYAAGVEVQLPGLFFFGASGRQAAPWGNGKSFMCVVPPVKRSPVLAGNGFSYGYAPDDCAGRFALDLNALWAAKPAKNPGQGAVVQAQFWYRDPQNTSNQTTSLSNALEFTVGP